MDVLSRHRRPHGRVSERCRKRRQRSDAEAEKASAEMVRREVIVKVTQAYYDLVLITKELDRHRARRPLIEHMEDIALKRYAAGTLPRMKYSWPRPRSTCFKRPRRWP